MFVYVKSALVLCCGVLARQVVRYDVHVLRTEVVSEIHY